MAELLLVNPRRRKRKKSSTARRKRRAAPRASRRRRRRSVAVIAAPRRRRRRRSVSRLRRRRNPSFRGGSIRGVINSFQPSVKAGLVGALGGLGLDVLLGQANRFLPPSLATGWGRMAVKLAAALGVGIIGGKVLRGKGAALTVGAMTVTLHEILRAQVGTMVPSLPLGDYMTFAPVVGYDNGEGVSTGFGTGFGTGQDMGAYLSDDGSGDFDAETVGAYMQDYDLSAER